MTSLPLPSLRRSRLALLALAALALAGCATSNRGMAASWPGLSAGQDRVFVADGPAVFAVDLTGQELWRYPQEPARDLTFFAPPAVSDDGVVYAGAYTGQLFALKADDGSKVWEFPAADGSDGTADGRIIASPTIAGDVLLVPTDGGTLFFLDRNTGKTLRTFTASGQLWSSPLVEGDTIYLTSLAHTVYAVNLATGEPIWSADLVYAIASSPALDGRTLLTGILGNSLVALDALSGTEAWRIPSQGWMWGRPAIADGQAFFGDAIAASLAKSQTGNVYALDTASRQILWQKATASVAASPLLVDDRVVFAFEDGHLSAYDRLNGGVVWDRTASAPIYADPVAAGGLVVVAVTTKGALLEAFHADTGEPAWNFLPATGK